MAYDAILTLAYGLDSLLERNGSTGRDAILAELDAAGTISDDSTGARRRVLGQQLYENTITVAFEGATGPVRFNQGETTVDLEGNQQINYRRGTGLEWVGTVSGSTLCPAMA